MILRSIDTIFTASVNAISPWPDFFRGWQEQKKEGENPFTLREEIRTMIQMSPDEGDVEPHEQKIMKQLFDFGETTAVVVDEYGGADGNVSRTGIVGSG